MTRQAWSNEEVEFLRGSTSSAFLQEIADHLGRPVKMVRWKAHQLGLTPLDGRVKNPGVERTVWTEESLQYLRDHASTKPVRQIAEHLGVSDRSVRAALYDYKIPGRGKGAPKPEESIQSVRDKARVRRESKYPPQGPWPCLSCKVVKPLSEFNANGSRPSHVCLRCERSRRIEETYGLSLDDYERMLLEQGGVCKLCKKPEVRTTPGGREFPLAVDHDHACCPGRKSSGDCIRGLLCWECNNLLGKIERTPGLEQAIVEYLTK